MLFIISMLFKGYCMLLCESEEDAKHALKLATQAREPFPWYEHEEIGYNYRMSNICAGIGRGQMKVLEQRVAQKNAIYVRYQEMLQDLPMTMAPALPETRPNRWLSVALLDSEWTVKPTDIIRVLGEANIESRHVWKPMHLQPVFRDCEYVKAGEEDVSRMIFEQGICLPSDSKMTEKQQQMVLELIHSL